MNAVFAAVLLAAVGASAWSATDVYPVVGLLVAIVATWRLTTVKTLRDTVKDRGERIADLEREQIRLVAENAALVAKRDEEVIGALESIRASQRGTADVLEHLVDRIDHMTNRPPTARTRQGDIGHA